METLQTMLIQRIQQLPWQAESISLLLDGITIKNLLHNFYTQQNQSKFEVLYLQTPFAELYEVSPCLVKIDNSNNPHLKNYLSHLNEEWGYLLISEASWEEQVKHLRNLLVVKQPNDEQVILKIADPMVADALFGLAEKQADTAFFGPFKQVFTTNIIGNQVNTYQRPEKDIHPLTIPYQLSNEQNEALDQLEIKRANHKLHQHMDRYFPNFLAYYPKETKKQAIDHLIHEANQLIYNTPMAQAYYLNIHGYLGDKTLENYPELSQLVNKKDVSSLKEASDLAQLLAKSVRA